VKADNNDGPT